MLGWCNGGTNYLYHTVNMTDFRQKVDRFGLVDISGPLLSDGRGAGWTHIVITGYGLQAHAGAGGCSTRL